MNNWRKSINLTVGVMGVLYPVAVWKAPLLLPVTPTLWLLVICVLRLVSTHSPLERILLVATAGLVTLMCLDNTPFVTRLYPVLINLGLLSYFGSTLLWPPTIIERFSRLRHTYFPQRAVVYTRRVTLVWCAFFLFNGSVSLATSLWANTEVWSLYNGVICYALIALLFATEVVFRRRMWRRVRNESASPADPLQRV